MNYRLRSSVKSKQSFFIPALILSTLFVLCRIFFPTQISSFFYIAATPFWSVTDKVHKFAQSIRAKFSSNDVLLAENFNLKTELYLEHLHVLELQGSEENYQTLLNDVHRNIVEGQILAKVISKPPQTLFDNLLVDVGSKSSVRVGDKVFAAKLVAIGTVESVASSFSQVSLYSTGGRNTDAIVSRNDTPVTLVGTGAGNFSITVPKDVDIEVGDRIIDQTFESNQIAEVYAINDKNEGSFKFVYAKLPINIFQLSFAYIENN